MRLDHTVGGETRTIGRRLRAKGPLTLEIEATPREYRFAAGGEELGRVATRSFSAETILESTGRHHFTGAMIGLHATGAGRKATAPADFEWFAYEGSETS